MQDNRKEIVCAVVVTFNRKKLLGDCLDALLRQTRPVDSIIIIDNASSDGTEEYLKENHLHNRVFDYVHLTKNTGGAGGFYEGMKRAYEAGYDWIWVMDDDVTATHDSLKELIHAAHTLSNFGFLASMVYGVDGHSMNVPMVDTRPGQNGYSDWPRFLSRGIVRIREATFVSLLFPSKTIKQFGLPMRELFIWGDDTEYTSRITNHIPAYLVGRSVVIHNRSIQTPPNISTETDRERIEKFFFLYRNRIYLQRIKSGRCCYKYATNEIIRNIARCLFSPPYRLLKSRIILSGNLRGLYFRPSQETIDS